MPATMTAAPSSLPGALLEPEEPVANRVVFDLLSALLLLGTALLGSYIPRYLAERAAEDAAAQERERAASDEAAAAAANGGNPSSTTRPPILASQLPPSSSAASLAFHLGNCLSAGVMLSAGFCHLLADSLRKLAFVGRFPLTPFLAATGYLLTLCADQVVQAVAAAAERRAAAEVAAMGGPLLGGAGGGGGGTLPLSSSSSHATWQRAPQGAARYGVVPAVDHAERDMERAQLVPLASSPPRGVGGLSKLRVPSSSLQPPHPPHAHGSGPVLLDGDVDDMGTSAYTSAFAAGALSPDGTALTPRRAAAAAAAAAAGGGGGGSSSPRRQQHRHVVEMVDLQPGGAPSAPSATTNNPASVPTTTVVAARLASGALAPGSAPVASPHPPQSSAAFAASGHCGGANLHHHDAAGIGALASSQHRLNFGTALLLAAALCVHSVLEGVALGAQQTLRDTEDIMLAIAAHKGLAAYALGASVVESGASAARFWTVAGLFAGATPVGIFIGLAVSDIGTGAVGAAMSALASGTFLYVAMMEVIPKELADPSHMALKMAALLLGFGAMSLLAVWA